MNNKSPLGNFPKPSSSKQSEIKFGTIDVTPSPAVVEGTSGSSSNIYLDQLEKAIKDGAFAENKDESGY